MRWWFGQRGIRRLTAERRERGGRRGRRGWPPALHMSLRHSTCRSDIQFFLFLERRIRTAFQRGLLCVLPVLGVLCVKPQVELPILAPSTPPALPPSS